MTSEADAACLDRIENVQNAAGRSSVTNTIGPLHPLPGRVFERGPTVPVESVPPNAFGVHAVGGGFHGEWTHDCWHCTYVGAPDDGSAWTSEVDDMDTANRVTRACDSRSQCGIGERMADNTFRVARILHPPTASPEREEAVLRRYSYPCRIVRDGDPHRSGRTRPACGRTDARRR